MKTEDILSGKYADKKESGTPTKTTRKKISPAELNPAIAEIALDRIDYPQAPTPVKIEPEVRETADAALDAMDCPLSRNRDWDCNKTQDGEELPHPLFTKGEEPQCKNGGFVKCPAYHRYFNWRIINRAGKRSKAERAE